MDYNGAAIAFVCRYFALGVGITGFLLYVSWRLMRAHERVAAALERLGRNAAHLPV